jgi:hypothetical protein
LRIISGAGALRQAAAAFTTPPASGWIPFTFIVLNILFSLLSIFVQLFRIIIPGIIGGAIIIIFVDKENISFDARLVTYINRTNIPPTNTMNRIYWNQNLSGCCRGYLSEHLLGQLSQ